MAKPDFIKPELTAMLRTYQLLDDCYNGSDAIKRTNSLYANGSHNNGGGGFGAAYSPYLPDPSPLNESDDVRRHRYASYLQRAVFYNVTRRTTDSLVAAIFSKYPVLDLNELDYLDGDVDGSGQSLAQQAKDAAMNCLLKGRGGLLADMPVNNGVSKANMAASGIRPTITNYAPESIINWRTSKVGAYQKLSLVVLSESYVVEDDGYEQKAGEQLLVLRLVDGQAESEVIRKIDSNWVSQGVNILTNSSGRSLDYIPFFFYGSTNNDSAIDFPPMYDIAELNVAHFIDSANYQEMLNLSANPTLVVTGLDQQWVDEVLENGIAIGSRAGIMLPVGGNAQLIQAQANGATYEAMLQKEAQMKSLGAKLTQESSGQAKTALQSAQDGASESNNLTTIAYNVSDAYTKAIRACGDYIGVATDGLFVTLNTQFNFAKLSPEQIDRLTMLYQAGVITFGELREQLVESEFASNENLEEVKGIIEQEQANLMMTNEVE